MHKKKSISVILSVIILLTLAAAVGGANAVAPAETAYTHSTLHFSVRLPASWSGLYRVEETHNSAWFISTNNEDAGYGGLLFGIEVYDEEEYIPTQHVELLIADGKYFYAVYPGGIECDYTNPLLIEEYGIMYEDIEGILETFHYAAEFPFTDVPADAWYYNDVTIAYQTGLINGTSATTFAPNSNLTYAEAVKLAGCMHQLYTTGAVTLTNGSPVWYQSYVDYARANGIISREYNWTAQATRSGYMEIFASALPDNALAPINTVADGAIPDVPMAHPGAAAIYKLYCAGILQGVDAAHSCNPAANIKRSEVAAILTRMMDSSERISFSF